MTMEVTKLIGFNGDVDVRRMHEESCIGLRLVTKAVIVSIIFRQGMYIGLDIH